MLYHTQFYTEIKHREIYEFTYEVYLNSVFGDPRTVMSHTAM